MNSLSANPYPSMGLADIQNSLSAMKNALKAYEALSPEDITKFPDHILASRVKYLQSYFKRLDDQGELKVPDIIEHETMFTEMNTKAQIPEGERIPYRTNVFEEDTMIGIIRKNTKNDRKVHFETKRLQDGSKNSNLVITMNNNFARKTKKEKPQYTEPVIKSEYILACFLGLHPLNENESKDIVSKGKIQSNLVHRKQLFAAFNLAKDENATKRKKLHTTSNFPTVFDAIQNRQDFEKLCSNHTIKQYEQHSETACRKLRGSGIEPRFKIRKFSQKSEIKFHNSQRDYVMGTKNSATKFASIKHTHRDNIEALDRLMKNQRAFIQSAADTQKLRERLNQESKSRKRNIFQSHY